MQLGASDQSDALHHGHLTLRGGPFLQHHLAQRQLGLRRSLTAHVAAQSALSVASLQHRYGRLEALRGISFEISSGVVGLLGPNGAGKSTLLSVLATMRAPQRGSVLVQGIDVSTVSGRSRARAVLGVLPQRFTLVRSMRVLDSVAYAAWCHGVPRRDAHERAREALERTGMTAHESRRVRQLSGGQRQRVGISCAIAHYPDVLLLDEPTAGLDPEVRLDFRRLILDLGREACVLVSTHLVEDVAHACERVLVLSEGTLRYDGPVSDLAARETGSHSSALEQGYLNALRTPSTDRGPA